MAQSTDTPPQPAWVNKATTFLEYGYPIVPLKCSFRVPKETEDPVIKQLGTEPLVNRITGAATTAQEIQKLGKMHEEARLATVTGEGVDLLALELNTTAGREQDPFWNKVRSLGKVFAGVKSATREYIFLPSPALGEPLPALTKKEGIVLHGEHSLVYLPGSLYEWRGRDVEVDEPSPRQEEKIKRARSILRLFDRDDHLASGVENGSGKSPPAAQGEPRSGEGDTRDHSSPGHAVNRNGRRENGYPENGHRENGHRENGHRENGHAPTTTPSAPPQNGSSGGTATSEGSFEDASQNGRAANGRPQNGSLSSLSPTDAGTPYRFRTGQDLAPSGDETSRKLNLPWMVPGGLSLMTGKPKVSGKSSWVTSLALHLSAGRAFLGYDTSPSDVVLMADMPPPSFREAIGQVGGPGLEGPGLGGPAREEALSHLHVVHPTDVSRLGWVSTLDCAYKYAEEVGGDLIIIDCIDRYISLKGGERPTENESVAQKLSAGAPPECPVLGVKSTSAAPGEPFSKTIDRLGILGVAADTILRLDNISTNTFPSLRRLSTASRQGAVCQTHLCAMQSGRYVRVTRSDLTGLSEHELLGGPPLQNLEAEERPKAASRFKTNGT